VRLGFRVVHHSDLCPCYCWVWCGYQIHEVPVGLGFFRVNVSGFNLLGLAVVDEHFDSSWFPSWVGRVQLSRVSVGDRVGSIRAGMMARSLNRTNFAVACSWLFGSKLLSLRWSHSPAFDSSS
jgi:hypothetical protein